MKRTLEGLAVEKTLGFFGLNKLAARAGVEQLRKLFQAAKHDPHALQQAEQLASQGHNILAGRNLPRGSQLRVLGAGGEGVAQHVLMPGARGATQMAADPLAARAAGSFANKAEAQAAHAARTPVAPQRVPGVAGTGPANTAVVKTYDPTSPIYNPAVQQTRQGLVGQDIPGFAKSYEMAQTPHNIAGQKAEYAINEYIPGKAPGESAKDLADVQKLQRQARTAIPGHEMVDVRDVNMVRDARTGKMTGIDYIPVQNEHMIPRDQRMPGMEHVVGAQVDLQSPTGRQFNVMNPNAPAPMNERIMRQADTQGALRSDYPIPQEGLNDQQMARLNQQMNAANKHYGGQLLSQAYGGRAEQAFRGRPVQQVAGQATRPSGPPSMATQAALPSKKNPFAGVSNSEIGQMLDSPVAFSQTQAAPPADYIMRR